MGGKGPPAGDLDGEALSRIGADADDKVVQQSGNPFSVETTPDGDFACQGSERSLGEKCSEAQGDQESASTGDKSPLLQKTSESAGPTLRLGTACILLCIQAVVLAAAAFVLLRPYRDSAEAKVIALESRVSALTSKVESLEHVRRENLWRRKERLALKRENEILKSRMQRNLSRTNRHPFEAITASTGHELPTKYGFVIEKTIWAYWYDPKSCPNSGDCVLPPQVQLCVETIEANKGSFDFKIVHRDEVKEYVSMIELPLCFDELHPAQQKDALMNALLARYGGVALDISSVLLRPLDDMWNDMVARGATFRGYMYRLNGNPWRHPESMAVWFLMSRREGVFSTAVRNQVIGMGDGRDTHIYSMWYTAFGDQTLTPILSMFNYTLPKCVDDVTVLNVQRKDGRYLCPEHEQRHWWKGLTGPPRNDTRIILEDPREGPQLPFACLDMELWNVSGNTWPIHDHDQYWDTFPGAPMYGVRCVSMGDCWKDEFLRRYHLRSEPGKPRLLNFIKMFNAGGKELRKLSRAEILSRKESFFYHWLKMAGLSYLE